MLDFIGENFEILPFSDAVKRLVTGRLRSRSAVITFDDGYPDWRHGVTEILSQRSYPATFFITSSQLEGRPLWQERLANIVRNHTQDILETQSVNLVPLNLRSNTEKINAIQALEYHFKYLPPVVRESYIEQLELETGITFSNIPNFSTNDLIEIANKGFEIGAHTHDHPILSLCDTERAKSEIGKSREILEGLIKRPVKGFAYPNGQPWVDFSWRNIEMVKAAGYEFAVTTQWGVADRSTSLYQIPRFTPWGPSRTFMYLQILRNSFTSPKTIPEECSK